MDKEDAKAINASLASVNASLVQLSVQAARADERLTSIQQTLTRHIEEEDDSLRRIDAIEEKLMEIHHAAKFTRITAAVVTALAGAWVWAKDHITMK